MHCLPLIRWTLIGCLASALSVAKGPQDPPNIVLILADDLGYSDLGSYGGEIQTPRLDALAENGLKFTQFYNTGRCWPTRAVLMTGYYAQQVGIDPRIGKDWPSWLTLLAPRLNEAGYRSYTSGKWHLHHTNGHESAGFARSYQLRDHDRFFSPERQFEDGVPLPVTKREEGKYTTRDIATRAIEYLGEHASHDDDAPFFLYLAFTSPHFPLHALPEDIAKYKGRYDVGWDELRKERQARLQELDIYDGELARMRTDVIAPWSLSQAELEEQIDPGELGIAIPWSELNATQRKFQAGKMEVHAAMIDRMDQEIGRVMDQVAAMGEADNTLVIFLSDNGATAEQINRGDRHTPGAPSGSADSYLALGPGWSTAANTPFSLHKHWNHEGGISTPFIVSWPAGINARGELRHVPAHAIDIVPTLLHVARAWPQATYNRREHPPAEQPQPLPGLSLVGAFASEPDWLDRPLFFEHSGNRALRYGDWKLVMRRDNLNRWELYNIKEDRAERNDLALAMPGRMAQLVQMWERQEVAFDLDAARP